MNAQTLRQLIRGPVGALETALDQPPADTLAHVPARGLALVCHPHPLHGGTMDNKVVQTLARADLQSGWRCLRLNYRGVGQSEGQWDEGHGETDDAKQALLAYAGEAEPILLAGFSFGGFIAAQLDGVVVVAPARPVAGTDADAPAVAEVGLFEAISWVQCARCGALVATSTDLLPYVELSSVVCHDCATSE